jgi:hypothetical protein
VLPLGSELWLLYFDAQSNNYVPKCVGTISRIVGDRYFAGGGWTIATGQQWGSEEAAREWIARHPFSAPSIK